MKPEIRELILEVLKEYGGFSIFSTYIGQSGKSTVGK